MSDLTLFQSSDTLPAHLQRGQLDHTTKALMGNNNKRISIKAGVWRMIVGGQEIASNEARAMNVVIIRASEYNSRMYYASKFKDGENVKPTCWSPDSIKPDASIKTPQASTCIACPQNIKGSGEADSRACRFQRRLAVVLENDIAGDIYALSVPAASLFGSGEGRKMPLQQYARFIGGHGIGINAVVTEMRFDTNATAPKITFSAVRPLEEAEWESVKNRGEDPAAIDACTMLVAQLDETEEKPAIESKPDNAITTKVVAKPVIKEEIVKPHVRPMPAKPSVPNVNAILEQWGDDDVDD